MPPTIPLSAEQEKAWLSQLSDDSGYGLNQENGTNWLMLQPTVFYNQRKRLINGRLVMGRLEVSKEHSILPLPVPQIENLGVSRLHGVLLPMEQGIALEDLGSTNGTRLNGLPLIPHRSYYLNHQDVVELGHLVLHVHFIAMDVFVKAMREVLVKRFSPEVQSELQGMVAPIEALIILGQRLPSMPVEQLQVLTAFKNLNEPLTLDKLHERINKVIGAGTDSLFSIATQGELTWTMPPPEKRTTDEVKAPTTILPDQPVIDISGDAKVTVPIAPSVSYSVSYQALWKDVHEETVKFQSRLEAFLERAKDLDTDPERTASEAQVNTMLSQMTAWLAIIKKLEGES